MNFSGPNVVSALPSLKVAMGCAEISMD